MMSHLCNRCVRELLILARTWFAFGLPSKPGVTSSPINIKGYGRLRTPEHITIETIYFIYISALGVDVAQF
jgi:hypothetical protein